MSTVKPYVDNNGNFILKGPCKIHFQTKNIKNLIKTPLTQPTVQQQVRPQAEPIQKPWSFMNLFSQKGGGEEIQDDTNNIRKTLSKI